MNDITFNENKTIKDWLETITNPIVRKQATHNIYMNNSRKSWLITKRYTENALNMQSAIRYGFAWNTTIEGFDYWQNIVDHKI
jgi:hypothetical protein